MLKELLGLIADINPNEIASHIAQGNLAEWCARWRGTAERVSRKVHNNATSQREGRWKGAGMGDYRCSLCDETVGGNHHNYCPSCGAYMK